MNDTGDAVELQISEVRNSQWTEATVTVRNLRGPAFRGARFQLLDGAADVIDLELIRILWYDRTVDEIPRGHTALITLSGTGAQALRPGTLADGFQSIEGHNGPHPGAPT
ncbi:MAG TPA: hypothetical protein VN408_01955 [Actinoplanes sp.]|nr:hypothetical protein [Actinoplanes sp.]